MDKLKLQVLLDLADRVTAPLKRIGAGAKSVGVDVSGAQDALRKLQQQQAAVGKMRSMQERLQETQQRMAALKAGKAALGAEMQKGGPTAQALGAQYRKTTEELQKLSAAHERQIDQAKRLRAGLSGMGITNVAQAEGKLREAIDRTTKALERQRKAQELTNKHRAAVDANKAARGDARGALFDGAAMAASLAAPLKMAVDFESSMADVDKVMDLDKSGLERMSQSAIDLSKRLPMAAKDIAQIMALGGQSGLDEKQLLGDEGGVGFVEHAVKMGTAFGMTAEESGEAMAKMKSAFGMSIPEVATLTDKINLLGNTGAANEKQILNIVTRVGPLGGVAGVAAGEIAALGSTLAGMGVQEEVAATGIQNLMLALVAGESATKSQREGLKALGLDSVEVAKSMQKDAAGTMLSIFEKVKGLDKYQQAAALQTEFGKESIKAIAPLLSQLDTLKENFAKVNDEKKYSGAVSAEYEKRAATTANRLKLAGNQAAAMGISLGNMLLPALNDGLTLLAPWMERLSALAQAYPGVTRGIVLFVAALVLGKVMAIAFGYGFALIKGAILGVRGVLVAARVAMLLHTGAMIAGTAASRGAAFVSKAFTAAQWLMNAALAANPIGIVILALVALAAAAYLIVTRWEEIKAGAMSLWTDLQGLAGRFVEIGGQLIDGLISGVTAKLTALKDTVIGAATSVGQWFKETLGIASPSRVFMEYGGWVSEGAALGIQKGQGLAAAAAVGLAGATAVPMAAAGTDALAAAQALPMAAAVPAMADMPAAFAAPAPLMAPSGSALGRGNAAGAGAPMAAPSGPINITIHAAPGMDPKDIARAVAAELDKRDRANKSRVLSQLSDTEG
ncbi:phage tail tape measure protein [Delftia acidovorans]|uniref:phage tail tape measure protein n=1 Tax=Delftia acidovorans TaxID=80866 RepID=UPI000BC2D1A0|nr:phage tail tape measure protein [Delftia acidovorans]ATH13818.1 phage tail tape measure protein [Delftia acidovorans]